MNTPVSSRGATRKRIALSEDLVLPPPHRFSTPIYPNQLDERDEDVDSGEQTLRGSFMDFFNNASS